MRNVLRRLIACVALTWVAAVVAVVFGRLLEPALGPLFMLFVGLVGIEVVRSIVVHDSGS